MLGRIRASLTGEPASPEGKSPKPSAVPQNEQQRPAAGFLPPFFSNSQPNGMENRPSQSRNLQAPPPPQSQERGFLGGLLSGGPPPRSPQSYETSPGTIRASAAALLKMATPPPLHHSEINPNGTNDGIDNEDLDKRDSLEYQINRRDQYISNLQHDLHKMQNQLGQFQKDNNTLRRQQLESTHRHSIAIKLWRRTNDGLGSRVECFENETTPAAAREIANLIRDAAPPNKDSAYLMMLQDQLTKATAKLDHLGSQTEIVLHKGEEVVESLREEMNEVIRERCRMELELLDQERMLEDDMRRMVIKTERRLKRVQGEIDFLEKNAVECLKSQEEEEDEEEEEGEGSDDEGSQEDEEDTEELEDAGSDEGDANSSDEKGDGEEGDGDSKEQANDKLNQTTEKAPGNGDGKKEPKKEDPQNAPESLRSELRKIATERDRSLSVLQKKLREKNEEFHNLMRLREGRQKSINKLEAEKRDREEWERSRRDII